MSALEYIDFLCKKLNELSIEKINYSDYSQMMDWIGEINKQVCRLESKETPTVPKPYVDLYGDKRNGCPRCPKPEILYAGQKYCSVCGQAIDWNGKENVIITAFYSTDAESFLSLADRDFIPMRAIIAWATINPYEEIKE